MLVKDLLMKNTSLFFLFSFSLNRAALTEIFETAKYTKSVSPASGLTRTGGSARYCLIAVRASSHFSFHPAWFAPLRVIKNCFRRFVNRVMNRPRAANRQLLYTFSRSGSRGLQNSFELSGVSFYPPLSHHETQGSARADSKGTL